MRYFFSALIGCLIYFLSINFNFPTGVAGLFSLVSLIFVLIGTNEVFNRLLGWVNYKGKGGSEKE